MRMCLGRGGGHWCGLLKQANKPGGKTPGEGAREAMTSYLPS